MKNPCYSTSSTVTVAKSHLRYIAIFVISLGAHPKSWN